MYRVLIVDDEAIMLNGLKRILSKIPEVTVVAKFCSSLQAREYLEENNVDIVFTDIRMPVIDGLELSRWIVEHKLECQIILISAYNEFSYARKAMEYGIKYYLTKPIRLVDVKQVIDQIKEEKDRHERKLIWHHNYREDIQEAEMYHALIRESKPSEDKLKKSLYYAEYQILFETGDYEKIDLNLDLVRTGMTNIFRWQAKQCVSVLVSQDKKELKYILLGENVEYFPSSEEIKERAKILMNLEISVWKITCGNANELIEKKRQEIAQDNIQDEVIKKAKHYIKQNLSKNISRDDVAEYVFLDSAYFSKYFRKKTGRSFHEYLQQERIARVKHFLERGYKVQDAMKEVGLNNRNHFNMVFKEYTGVSPSEYRKQYNSEE